MGIDYNTAHLDGYRAFRTDGAVYIRLVVGGVPTGGQRTVREPPQADQFDSDEPDPAGDVAFEAASLMCRIYNAGAEPVQWLQVAFSACCHLEPLQGDGKHRLVQFDSEKTVWLRDDDAHVVIADGQYTDILPPGERVTLPEA